MKGRVISLLTAITFAFSVEATDTLKRHLQEGEFEEILLLLKEKRAIGSISREELIILARANLGLGLLEEAKEIVEELLESNPSDQEALLLKAEILIEEGYYKKAKKILKKLPPSPRKNYLLVVLYLNVGNTSLAKSMFAMIPETAQEKKFSRSLLKVYPEFTGYLTLSAGYDSNPTVTPEFIAGKGSVAYKTEGNLTFNGEKALIRGRISYTGYRTVEDFNTLRSTLGIRYLFGKLFIPALVDYVSLGGDFYKWQGDVGFGLFVGETALSFKAGYQNYYGVQRDGPRFSATASYLFTTPMWFVNLSVSLGYENVKSADWKNYSLYPYFKTAYERGRFIADFKGGLAFYTFENTSGRRDNFLILSPSLKVKIYKLIKGEFSFKYSRNYSTVEIYRYERSEVYAGVGGVF